jgi:cysteine-rich repeat protein
MRFGRVAIILALAALTSCQRPVTGREFTGGEIREVRVDPEFVRQGVPIRITFRLDGGVQGNVSYSIGNKTFDCVPERLSDGRYQCVHAGVSRTDYSQGESSLIVKAKDRRGNESEGSTPITLDFDCPQIRSLSITPAIGSPGTTAIVFIESNEVLNLPPVISRGGMIWESPVGNGTSWQVDHLVTEQDTSSSIDIVVRIADLAGNTSGDCGVDGRAPFSVDRTPPIVAAEKIQIVRDVPGSPAIISAEAGAFADDVGIQEIRVLATSTAGGDQLVATLFPEPDGSLLPTPIAQAFRGRARVQTIDVAEQASEAVLVKERWRVSVGMGDAEDAAIRTAARYTPPAPRSPSLDNRTRELAVALFSADTESAVAEARIAFNVAGTLPTSYRNTEYIAAGYDPRSKSIVAFGGLTEGTEYRDSTLVIRWNELSGMYEHELFAADPGQTPAPRAGTKIAFDDNGCGVLFGGFDQIRYFDDVWQVCIGENHRPTWTAIDDGPSPPGRFAPIIWDPVLDRFLVSFGAADESVEEIAMLDPGDRTGPWRWVALDQLPDGLEDSARYEHAFYYEPKVSGYALGLGTGFFYYAEFWTFSEGEWTMSELPFDLWGRFSFGYSYDLARSSLVVFGDGRDVPADVDDDVWFLADDPRDGAQAWRRIELTPSLVRGNPVLVYDSDRQTTVVFGGRRYHDLTPVPPDIEVLTSPPSFAMLEADLDLDDARPDGIDALELLIRATGSGDGDSIGPGTTADGGVTVRLYDHLAKEWVEVAVVATPEAGLPISIPVTVTDDPARFVSPDGVVPVNVSTRYPATEEVAARLEVDLVDGHLVLSAAAQPGAKIVDFAVSTNDAVAGHPIDISWTVRDAPQGIEIKAGARTVVATAQLSGSVIDAPLEATTYELIAKNSATGDARRTVWVDVRPAEGAPIILSFAADEAAAPRGGQAHLRWTTDRAATVRILRGETEVHRTTTETTSGSFDADLPVGVATSTVFRIEASTGLSYDMRSDTVLLANERIITGPNSTDNFAGALAVFGEQDLYIVDMTEPGYIGAEVWVPDEPNCTDGVDTYMYLLDASLVTIGSNDDGGVDGCSRINPATDRYSLVPAGRYYLRVEEYGNDTPIPAYTLRISTTPIACGNGVLEPTEGCDDGNITSNDGCSSLCRIEVDGIYNAPGDGRVTIAGSIPIAGALGVYQINVASTTVIRAETFVPATGTCTGEDTLLEVLADDQLTVLARDDDSGVGSCSLLATALAPGTYFLVVHEYGDNGDIPAFEVVIEPISGILGELEPNGVSGEASAIGSVGAGSRTATIAGSIAPSGDEDWYVLNLTTPGAMRITTFTLLSNRGCNADTVLTFFDDTLSQIATEDDVNGYCAVLDGISGAIPSMSTLSAGTYYVRINGYSSSLIPAYYFDVEVQ